MASVIPENNLQFDRICRTCLSEGELKSIFVDSNAKEVNLIQMLSICTSLNITENDELPLQICKLCVNEVNRAYNFKQRCERSEATLRYYLRCTQQEIKNECNIDIENVIIKSELSSHEESLDVNEIKVKKKRKKLKTVSENEWSDENNGESFESDEKIDDNDIKLSKQKNNLKCTGPPFPCKRCDETFASLQQLTEHRKTTKHPSKRDHVCSVCSKTFTFSHLKIHMRTHTAEKPFSCQICGQCFSLNCNLQRHLLIHSGERPFKCHVCEKSFTQSSTLSQHLQTHNDSEKSYLCSYCGRGFTCMAGLRSHSKIHTGIRPYPCTVCGKSFTHIGTMKSHLLIHTGQKPFVCSVCNRAFTQRNHLRYHLRTHSGERPFNCSVCGKTFSLKGNLTVHTRTHTGETPYHCPVCGKGFYDSSSMKKHKKSHVEHSG